jgi:hypothetical protein
MGAHWGPTGGPTEESLEAHWGTTWGPTGDPLVYHWGVHWGPPGYPLGNHWGPAGRPTGEPLVDYWGARWGARWGPGQFQRGVVASAKQSACAVAIGSAADGIDGHISSGSGSDYMGRSVNHGGCGSSGRIGGKQRSYQGMHRSDPSSRGSSKHRWARGARQG